MQEVIVTKYLGRHDVLNRTYYMDGKKHGTDTEYYVGGTVRYISNYVNGKLNGEYKTFYNNGILKTKQFYVNNKLEGEKIYNYSNGQPQHISNYKNNKRHGEYLQYYKSDNYHTVGQLMSRLMFKNGMKHGVGINMSYIKDKITHTYLFINDTEVCINYFEYNTGQVELLTINI